MTPHPSLTRADILAADAPQLRLWCAEHLFGYSWHPGTDGMEYFRREGNFAYGAVRFASPNGEMRLYDLPDYPNDIGAAWTVVEKMRAAGWQFRIVNDNMTDGMFFCAFEKPKRINLSATEATACMAISRAALIAVTGAQ